MKGALGPRLASRLRTAPTLYVARLRASTAAVAPASSFSSRRSPLRSRREATSSSRRPLITSCLRRRASTVQYSSGLEGVDLPLPVHHQAHGDGLHPPGGEALLDLVPQQRAQLVAHQAVDHAPRLLGVDEVAVDGPGVLEGLLDGVAGDLVEHDPAGLHRAGAGADGLRQVPGDGLPFAVGVGGQEQLGGVAGLLGQLLDELLLLLGDDVAGLELVLDVHPQAALGQVPDVAERGLHGVAPAEELLDRLRFRWRLDDHQLLQCPGHVSFCRLPNGLGTKE